MLLAGERRLFQTIILAGWAYSASRDGIRRISPFRGRSHSSKGGSQPRVGPFDENDDFKTGLRWVMLGDGVEAKGDVMVGQRVMGERTGEMEGEPER